MVFDYFRLARLPHSEPSSRNAHGRDSLRSAYARRVTARTLLRRRYLFSNKFVRELMYYEKHVFSDNSVLTSRETPREDSLSSADLPWTRDPRRRPRVNAR